MVRWRGDARFFLVLASLCCVVSFSNGRVLPNLPSSPSARVGELERDGFESSAEFYRIVAEVPSTTKTDVEGGKIQSKTRSSASEAQNCLLGLCKIFRRNGDTDDQYWQLSDPSIPVIQGKKWTKTFGKIAEWVLHAIVVVLVVGALSYLVSCLCACCIGLDLLAEIWRRLGGWSAFDYFVNVAPSVAEIDPEPLPLLRSQVE